MRSRAPAGREDREGFGVGGPVLTQLDGYVRGRLLERAKLMLVSAGCSVGAVTRRFSKKVKRGRVISERPGPGSGLPELAKVRLVVSKGRPER